MNVNVPKLVVPALSFFLVVTSIFTGGCSSRDSAGLEAQILEDVSLEEAYILIVDNLGNQDFVIFDVRTPEEYAGGHIEKAINLDYSSETFADELNELDKDSIYLVYSQTDRLGGKALAVMAELGFREVYNLRGGIEGWEEVKLPTVK